MKEISQDFTRSYIDAFLADAEASSDPIDRLSAVLGTGVSKKLVDDMLRQRLEINFAKDVTLSDAEKKTLLDIQYEAWIASMKKAHLDECLSCDELLGCAPMKRLMSSIIVSKDGGPMCAAYEKAFSNCLHEIMREVLERRATKPESEPMVGEGEQHEG